MPERYEGEPTHFSFPTPNSLKKTRESSAAGRPWSAAHMAGRSSHSVPRRRRASRDLRLPRTDHSAAFFVWLSSRNGLFPSAPLKRKFRLYCPLLPSEMGSGTGWAKEALTRVRAEKLSCGTAEGRVREGCWEL